MDCPFEIVTYFCSCFNYLLVSPCTILFFSLKKLLYNETSRIKLFHIPIASDILVYQYLVTLLNIKKSAISM